jgi:hypothetical protein
MVAAGDRRRNPRGKRSETRRRLETLLRKRRIFHPGDSFFALLAGRPTDRGVILME